LEELAELGARIGSDVPFFFSSSAAVVTGRGEVLQPFDHNLGGYPLVVYPGVEVSTAWAYRVLNPRLTLDRAITNIAALFCKRGDVRALADVARNDFRSVVFGEYPVLRKVVDGLTASGAVFAGMSGSGSSLFGFFTVEEERREAYLWAQEEGFSAWAIEWVHGGV
jgi:4-diphosphocytidyl-2-C-methyl-D-erythritol kinase